MPAEQFSCSDCQATLPWSPEAAGRQVRCAACGQVVRVPDVPAPQDPVETYDLDLGDDDADAYGLADPEPDTAATHNGRCPACNSPLADNAVICMNCGFDTRTGDTLRTQQYAPPEEGATATATKGAPLPPVTKAGKREAQREAAQRQAIQEHHKKDVVLPLTLAGIGLALMLVNLFALAPMAASATDTPIVSGMIQFGARSVTHMLLSVPILLLALFVVANVMGTGFGELKTALIKLVAIATLASAVWFSVEHLLTYAGITTPGTRVGIRRYARVDWLLYFATFYGLTIWLLEAEPLEAFVLWCMYKLTWIAVVFSLWSLFL